MLTKDGKTQNIARWAEELGLSDRAIRNRLKRGMSVQEALSQKKYSGGRRASAVSIQLKEGCCLPDCLNCPLPECNYNGRPTREETQMTKEALRKFPDSPAAYSHVYKIPRLTGKIRQST